MTARLQLGRAGLPAPLVEMALQVEWPRRITDAHLDELLAEHVPAVHIAHDYPGVVALLTGADVLTIARQSARAALTAAALGSLSACTSGASGSGDFTLALWAVGALFLLVAGIALGWKWRDQQLQRLLDDAEFGDTHEHLGDMHTADAARIERESLELLRRAGGNFNPPPHYARPPAPPASPRLASVTRRAQLRPSYPKHPGA